jgi:hypothetical protein
MKRMMKTAWNWMLLCSALVLAGCTGGLLREHVQDRVQAVLQAGDGSYMVLAEKHYVDMPAVCFENCSGDAVSHLWVLRLNREGDVLWEKTFKRHWDDYVEAGGIAELEDGRFLIAAWSSRSEGLWLLCIDGQGRLDWDMIDSSDLVSYYPLSVESAGPGLARVAGIGRADENGLSHNVRVLTVSSDGEVKGRMESVTLPGDMKRFVDVKPGSDGGVTVLAEIEAPDPRTEDGYPQLHYSRAVRINASGRIAWDLVLDPEELGETEPRKIVQTGSGHALLAHNVSALQPAARLFMLDPEGGVLGETVIEGFWGHVLAVDGEGAVLLAGAEAGGNGCLEVRKLGPDGLEIWSGRFADVEGFYASSLALTDDRGLVVGEMATARVVKIDGGGSMDWSRDLGNETP